MNKQVYYNEDMIKKEKDRNKKIKLLESPVFKCLEKNNPMDFCRLILIFNKLTYDELESIFYFMINKKCIQKAKYC